MMILFNFLKDLSLIICGCIVMNILMGFTMKITFIYVFLMKESRRRRQMEAAEKRRQENENRGIKDVERLRRQQQRQLDIERRQEEAMSQNNQSSNLKVNHKKHTIPNNIHLTYFFLYIQWQTNN